MTVTGLAAIVFGIVMFAKPGAGALAVLALIAAFALVSGISELVVAIGGEKLVERKAKTVLPPGVAEDDSRAVALTVDLHDRTSAEPAIQFAGSAWQRRPRDWQWRGIARRHRVSTFHERSSDDRDRASERTPVAPSRWSVDRDEPRRSTSRSRRCGA